MHNLRLYIKNHIKEHNLNPRKVALEAGFSAEAITDFLKEPPAKQSIRSLIIKRLAQHWEVSVDEMTGRIERKQQKTLDKSTTKAQSFVEKLNEQGAQSTNKSRSR